MHNDVTRREARGELWSLWSQAGLVTWPFCGQITRFWLFYFLFGLEKNVWPFGSILAFLSSDRNF
jgi:hypothetical protein